MLRSPRPPHRRPVPAVAAYAALVALLTACSSSAPARIAEPTAPTTAASTAGASVATEAPLALPDTTRSTVGGLADGFPSDLVTLPGDADVLVSSAQPVDGGDLVEISLNLRTTLSAEDLMQDLRDSLDGAGFSETPAADLPDGVAAQSAFARESGELVTVAVLDRDGVRTLTLGGRVAVT
ncbi:hypothetical protein [Cellulomonas gilvus]|uniref:Lipoprotein n=1 Tax=Cellulomonas gilvus (strain ATCC 13127 / NRRL B-14078) TaxID=593907 RepID=F8A3Q7_CELGA|nr:hypothetical protein [Cellulomonas gilvus]AEI11960.1 hypothetical protein Celgi_1441 [Cellulomonas gilvus ATCC 13127]